MRLLNIGLKIIFIIIFIFGLSIIFISFKYKNCNSLFYGKYKIESVVKTLSYPLKLPETEAEAKQHQDYLDFELNYDNSKFINKTIEINNKFIKLDNKIILENPQYEMSIIPTKKVSDFYYKKIPSSLNDIINENEDYFIYVDIVNMDIENFKEYYYLSSFYLKDETIILDADGFNFTRYKGVKLENVNKNIAKINNIRFDKYTSQLFYGAWKLNYNNRLYEININEEILDLPYEIIVLKSNDLNNKQKKIFKDFNSNIICIEFKNDNLYKDKIKKIYILGENLLIVYIKGNYYELNRIGDITQYNYSNGI